LDKSSLRLALRQHTQDIHARLDEVAGTFGTLGSYRTFVARSLRFRKAAEPRLRGNAEWQPQSLLPELQLDAEDLSLEVPTEGPPMAPLNAAERVGALYVLEGSALGAHVLFERARALGLNESRGARHLAKQTGDAGRWRNFLGYLDARSDLDRAAVLGGAMSMFETALAVYSGAR
jgi:heme oxygenase